MAARPETSEAATPADGFASLVEAYRQDPAVSVAKMFGAPCLKTGGKVFATFFHEQLVVKLPRERVQALAGAGAGEPFDPGMGRVMKEWVALSPGAEAQWPALAEEARAYVAAAL
jgi:hypothetical protein